MRTITEGEIRDFVVSDLRWSATRWWARPEPLEQAFVVYRQLIGHGLWHVPFHLVADLSLLFACGFETPFISEKLQDQPEQIRPLLLRYENEILGSLLQQTEIQSVIELLSFHKKDATRNNRLVFLLSRIFAPLVPKTHRVSPATLRGLPFLPPKPDEVSASADRVGDLERTEALEAFLDNASMRFRWWRLLQEEDFFELEHLDVLTRPELRIGCRQTLELERLLGDVDTRTVEVAEESQEADTAFLDETYYPTGGLSGLTNRGSFENLVTSELIYLEPGPVDLFSLRHLEGELLYFMRDSGRLRRKRRTIHLIIDLGRLFFGKSMGYDYQFAMVAQGLCLRVIRDLFEVFAMDALRFELHFIHHNRDVEEMQREVEVMHLILGEEAKHDRVRLHSSAEIDPKKLIDPTRKVYALAMAGSRASKWSKRLERLTSAAEPVLGLVLHVGDARPNTEALFLPIGGAPLQTLRELKNDIVRRLAGLKAS